MTISALPTPPSRADDPANFSAKADALLGGLPTFVTQVNATAAQMSQDAAAAAAGALAASDSEEAAAVSASAAAAAAAAAQVSAGAVAWVSGATYTVGAVVWSPVTRLLYRRIVAGAGATDPSADATNWALASSGAPQLIVTSAASVAGQANGHYVLTCTGMAELVLPATPAAGTLIWVTVGNDRTDNVVRRSGELINKLAEDMQLDDAVATVALRYINSTIGWRALA